MACLARAVFDDFPAKATPAGGRLLVLALAANDNDPCPEVDREPKPMDLVGRPVSTLFSQFTTPPGVTWSYDAAGRRIGEATTGQGQATNGFALTFTYDKAGNPSALTWPDQQGVTYSYDTANRQGSIIAAVDHTGAATPYVYDPHGVPAAWGTVGANPRFAYTGQIVIPEAQLYYYKARVYDSVSGRFLQTDPVGYEGGLNLYDYVANDPVNRFDPDGLDAVITLQRYSVISRDASKNPNHSFVVIKDTNTGQTWIARAGPDVKTGPGFIGAALMGQLYVKGVVTSAAASLDTNVINNDHKAVVTVDSTTVAGVTGAAEAAKAQSYISGVNSQNINSNYDHNSNSVGAGTYQQLTGKNIVNPAVLPGSQNKPTVPAAPQPPPPPLPKPDVP